MAIRQDTGIHNEAFFLEKGEISHRKSSKILNKGMKDQGENCHEERKRKKLPSNWLSPKKQTKHMESIL